MNEREWVKRILYLCHLHLFIFFISRRLFVRVCDKPTSFQPPKWKIRIWFVGNRYECALSVVVWYIMRWPPHSKYINDLFWSELHNGSAFTAPGTLNIRATHNGRLHRFCPPPQTPVNLHKNHSLAPDTGRFQLHFYNTQRPNKWRHVDIAKAFSKFTKFYAK